MCHLSGAARDGGTVPRQQLEVDLIFSSFVALRQALAGLSSYSGAYNASEISARCSELPLPLLFSDSDPQVRSCFHGLVPMGGRAWSNDELV